MGNCIAIFADPASMFNLRALEGTRQELAALLSGSSHAGTDGFDIQVGRSINACTVHTSQDVLGLYPTLNDRLIPECRIVNADPVVLAIVIEHLQTMSVFGFRSINAFRSSIEPRLGYYLKCLKRVRHRLQPLESTPLDSEPFVYLRNNLGNHSKAQKFLIDFHAGLMRQLRLSDLRLLPSEIGDLITDRWLQLSGRARKDSHQSEFNHDRIAAEVTQNEAIEHSIFQIQYLYGGTGGRFGLNPPLPVSPRMKTRKSFQTTLSSASAGTRSSLRGSADSVKDLSQPRLDNPSESSTSEQNTRKDSESVAPRHVLAGQNTPQIASRSSLADRSGRRHPHNQASRRSSVSFASDLPSHAPFMSGSPNRAAGRTR